MTSNDTVDPKDFGTSKRTVKSVPKQKPDLRQDFQRLVNWIDNNILPVVFLVILAGLAVKGAQQFIPEMNQNTQLVVSILVVSVLVVKIKARYNG